MASIRLSQLQKHILRWVTADRQRTNGVIASSHPELVYSLRRDKGNISHSLRTLERHGFLILGRSSGGRAELCFVRKVCRFARKICRLASKRHITAHRTVAGVCGKLCDPRQRFPATPSRHAGDVQRRRQARNSLQLFYCWGLAAYKLKELSGLNGR
jgi:hypothetical protein